MNPQTNAAIRALAWMSRQDHPDAALNARVILAIRSAPNADIETIADLSMSDKPEALRSINQLRRGGFVSTAGQTLTNTGISLSNKILRP